jgi:putative membrane protein
MIDRFFGSDARARVEAAVREAEARSLGQIVPVVVEKCDDYPEARYRGALLAAGVATLLALLLHAPLTVAELPVVQLVAGVAGALLSRWDPLERLLIGRRELDESARERALRAFHEHGLHLTAHGTGVLVFAALFEREAVVLGDHGIHAKVGDAGWADAVAALSAGLRRGDPATGFCDAIGQVGAALARHFPRGPGGPGGANELPDELRATRT